MKRFIFVLLFIVSFDSLACMVPIHGEQYDALIEIKKVDKNVYKVSVPREVENRKNPIILLAYTEETTGEYLFAEEQKLLTVVHKENKSLAYFRLTEGGSKKYYARVIWPIKCCLCDVIANSRIIEYEE
jgi:hypothetical protein